jgi:hypothetical protein
MAARVPTTNMGQNIGTGTADQKAFMYFSGLWIRKAVCPMYCRTRHGNATHANDICTCQRTLVPLAVGRGIGWGGGLYLSMAETQIKK